MLPRFRYHKPATLDEAVGLLGDFGPEASLLAGGTDLLVGLGDGTMSAGHLIDIKGIPELSEIGYDNGTLSIGACVTVNRLLRFTGLPTRCRAIHGAAWRLATHQIRNRATVVGNICNASPACDMGPPLLVLDASLRTVSARGERTIPLKGFFRGVKSTCCEPAEIVTEIVVPVSEDTVSGFGKRTRIRGHDLSLVNGAAACENGSGVRIALGGVAPTPLLIEGLERWGLSDRRKMVKRAVDSISPIDDVRSSKSYRLAMAEKIVDGLLRFLSASGEGDPNV